MYARFAHTCALLPPSPPHALFSPQPDRFIGRFLCGLEVHTKSGDPATATIHGNLIYPRVLVAGAEDTDGDGLSAPRMECSDPIECVDRCKYLSRTSSNGAGTPPTCALCDQYCPNDVISTIDQLREAVYSDILTAIRITFKCMGASKDQLEAPQGIMMRPGVCICQLVKILAPEWRKQAAKDPNANKELLCTDGDPFETIMSRVFEALGDSMQKAAEEVGDAIIDGYEAVLTGIFNFFGGQGEVQLTPPEPCITNLRNVIDPGNRNKHCGKSIAAAYETAIKFQCERAQPKWKRCYYERVRDICLNNDFIQQYYGLFDKGFESVGALEAAFSDAFGDAFADEDPTLGSIVSAAARSIQAPRDLDGRKNICSGETLLNSLPLDQLIIRCARAHSSPRTFPGSRAPPLSHPQLPLCLLRRAMRRRQRL